MRFDLITLFPRMFDGVLGESILKRAAAAGIVSYHVHDLRHWSDDPKHHKVDAPPYGGGPGMVIQPEPLVAAVAAVDSAAVAAIGPKPGLRVLLTPKGEPLTQRRCEALAGLPRLTLVCGHYEGFDQRGIDALRGVSSDSSSGRADAGDLLEISIGDYVLSGGELPAMVLLDAVVRLLPGAIGDAASHEQDSFSGRRILDHPHYTRPAVWRERAVPEVLTRGDHAAIERWRSDAAVAATRARRPDLLGGTSSGAARSARPAPPTLLRELGDPSAQTLTKLSAQLELPELMRDAAVARLEATRPAAAVLAVDGSAERVVEAGLPQAVTRASALGLALMHPVGTIDAPNGRGVLAVTTLHVHPEHRRRGLGQALLGACVAAAREARACTLVVPLPPKEAGLERAERFLKACGFAVFETTGTTAYASLTLRQDRPPPPGPPLL